MCFIKMRQAWDTGQEIQHKTEVKAVPKVKVKGRDTHTPDWSRMKQCNSREIIFEDLLYYVFSYLVTTGRMSPESYLYLACMDRVLMILLSPPCSATWITKDIHFTPQKFCFDLLLKAEDWPW